MDSSLRRLRKFMGADVQVGTARGRRRRILARGSLTRRRVSILPGYASTFEKGRIAVSNL